MENESVKPNIAVMEYRQTNTERNLESLTSLVTTLSGTVRVTHESVLVLQQSISSLSKIQEEHAKDIEIIKTDKIKVKGGWIVLSFLGGLFVAGAGIGIFILEAMKELKGKL